MPRPGEPTPSEPAPGLDENKRMLISFLLFLHLFALAVGISSRATATTSGRETFEMRLRNVPHKDFPVVQAYLQLLWMDLSYSYHLTYGSPAAATTVGDQAVWIDVVLERPDGTMVEVQLPDASIRLPLRRLHYECLARRAAVFAEDTNQSGTLPQSIAARLVAETGATRGRLWIRQMEMPLGPFLPLSGNARTLYEAEIIVAPQGVVVRKVTSAFEDAPVAAPNPAAGATDGQ